jgi:AraC-like DNA-binding protein
MLEWDIEGHEPHIQRVISNPCVQIVVDKTGAYLMGVVTGPYAVTLSGRGFVLGVRFRPGGFHPFWPGPIAELTNRRLRLPEVLPGVDENQLRRQAARGNGKSIWSSLEEVLRSAAPSADPRGEQACAIAEEMANNAKLLTVTQVAQTVGVSPRALQRLFRTYVGVSPKWLIRRYRLQEAAARAEAGETQNWSALALSLGYFDQAHFVNDFKRMIGLPPGEYMRLIGTA